MSYAWTDDADEQAGWRHTSDPVALRTVRQAETFIVWALLLGVVAGLVVAFILGLHQQCERLTAQHQSGRVCAVQR